MAEASRGESTLRRTGMFRTVRFYGWRIKADLIVSQGSKSRGVGRGEISINQGDFWRASWRKRANFWTYRLARVVEEVDHCSWTIMSQDIPVLLGFCLSVELT